MAENATPSPTDVEFQRWLETTYPSPEVQAAQRGVLGQALAGTEQAVVGVPALVARAASTIPYVRGPATATADFLESLAPTQGPGVVEAGVRTAGTSAGAIGVALGVNALTGIPAPLIVGGLFGLAQVAETRDRLEKLNAEAVKRGQAPMSTQSIYTAAVTNGVIEGVLETATGYLTLGRFFPKTAQGLTAARDYAVAKILPDSAPKLAQWLAKGGEEYVRSLGRELPTEMAQAYGETEVERRTLGPERLAALEHGGVAVPPTGGEAARQVVGPVAISSALIPGALGLAAKLTRQPMSTPAGGVQTAVTPAVPPPTSPAPVPPTAPPAPPAPPVPPQTAPPPQGPIDPLLGLGAPSTTGTPPGVTPQGTGVVPGVSPQGPGEAVPVAVPPAAPSTRPPGGYEASIQFTRPPSPRQEQALRAHGYTPDDASQLQWTTTTPPPPRGQGTVPGITPTPPAPTGTGEAGSPLSIPIAPQTSTPEDVPVSVRPSTPQVLQPTADSVPVTVYPQGSPVPLEPDVQGPPGLVPVMDRRPPDQDGGGGVPPGPPTETAPVVPTTPVPPEAPVTAAAPPTPTPPVPPEAPAVATPAQGIVDMRPQDLATDAERFQYKIKRSAKGVTGSLAGAQAFDQRFAAPLAVWLDPADGKTYVVNGHNRLDLALRKGAQSLRVEYIDAPTAAEARAEGALRNIAEGQGTAVDAAKFLRESGRTPADLEARGITLSAAIARDAVALANLNPALFGMVVRGDFPQERAVILGATLSDASQQKAVVDLLSQAERRGRKPTNEVVRELVDMAREAPQQTMQDMTLFGTEERSQSLALEKASLMAYVRGEFSRQAGLFGTVGHTRASEELSRAGNVIDVEQSQAKAQEAHQLLALFDQMKHLSGDVAETINAAARRLGAGEDGTTVRHDLLRRLREVLPQALGPTVGPDGSGGQSVPGQTGRVGSPAADTGDAGLFGPRAGPAPEPGTGTTPLVKPGAGSGLPRADAQGAATQGASAVPATAGPEQQLGEVPGSGSLVPGSQPATRNQGPETTPLNTLQAAYDQARAAEGAARERSAALPNARNRAGRTPEARAAKQAAGAEMERLAARTRDLQGQLETAREGTQPPPGKLQVLPQGHAPQSPLAPTFFSRVKQVIQQKMGRRAAPGEIARLLDPAKSGVKHDELRWLGLQPWLDAHEGPVTKQELLDFLEQQQVQVVPVESTERRFAGYTEPGADPGSYREILLTLPRHSPGAPEEGYVHEGHFPDVENIVAHLRMNDRTDAQGRKVLFLEEVQSDWQREGRKEGFLQNTRVLDAAVDNAAHALRDYYHRQGRPLPTMDDIVTLKQDISFGTADPAVVPLLTAWEDAREASERAWEGEGVPMAPFVTTGDWYQLPLKWALRHASEHGYDGVAWTTGAMQVERYFGAQPDQSALTAWRDATKPQSIREQVQQYLGSKLAAVAPLKVMDAAVLPLLQHDQVRRAVIEAIPVDVVDILAANGVSPDQLLREPDMVSNVLPVKDHAKIARGLTFALESVGTRLRTALNGVLTSQTAGRNEEVLPAVRASDLSAREIVGALAPSRLYGVRGDLPYTSTSSTGGRTEAPMPDLNLAGIRGEPSATELAGLLNRHSEIIAGSTGDVITKYVVPEHEWATNLYDKTIPQFLSKYGKQWGAGVEMTTLDTGSRPAPEGFARVSTATGQDLSATPVPFLPITPTMRQSVLTQGQPLFQRTGEVPAGLGPLRLDEVRRQLDPYGLAVVQHDDGSFRVALGPGSYVDLQGVDHVSATEAEMRLGYGRALTEADRVAGRTDEVTPGIFRVQVGPHRTELTIPHELFGHVFEEGGLYTARELATMDAAITKQGGMPGFPDGPEARAEYMATNLNQRRSALPEGPLGRLIQKVQGFIDSLAKLMGLHTTGQIFRRVERGGMVQEQGRVMGETPGRLQVTPTPQDEEQRTSVVPEATPRDIQQSGRQSDMGNPRTEWKLTFDYAGIANLFTPEQRTQIEAHFGEGRPLQRKETISNKELDEHAAQQIRRWDGDRDGYITFMQGLANNDYGPTDIQAQALRAIARENFEMGESLWRAGIWSDDDFYQFEDRYFAQDNSLAFARQARSMAGRILQAGQAPTDAEVYHDLRRRLRDIEGQSPAEDIARLEAETKEAMKLGDYYRLRAVGKQIENPTLKEVWKEFYINSLLSSPSTLSANLWSTNGYMLFKQALVRPAQGVIDKAFSVFTGRAQENFVQSGLPALGEFGRGFTKQFQQAWWLFRNDARASQIPDWQKSGEFGAIERIPPASMRRAVDPRDPTRPLTWVRKLAPVFDWAGRVMEAMDVGMRGLAFDMNFAAMARDASLKLGLDAPRDRTSVSAWERQWMSEQMADPVTGKMSDLAKQALDQAQRDIFRDAPSKFVQQLARLGESKGFDLMSFMLFPFKYTPDRLLARGFELLPGNPYYLGGWAKRGLTGEWRGWMPVWKFDAATMGTSADSLMFAKQAVGAVMTGVLYGMWHNGLLTGSAPDDPLERENFYREGKIPHAARVGDTWLSYRRFEPLSLPLGIMTTVFEAASRLKAKHARDGTTPDNIALDYASLGTVAGTAVTNFLLDSSYLAGIAAFFEGTQRGREAGDLPRGVYRQIATTLTPLVGLQRSLIRAFDAAGVTPGSVPGTTMIRQPHGLLETMQGTGLPWALMGLPEPRLDVYGRGQSRDTSWPGEIIPGMPPVARGHVQGGKREEEFQKLRYFPGHMPQKDALGIKYPDDVYRQLELARGPWLLDQHDAIVESPSWDRWTPEQKLRKLRAITSEANRRARRQVLGPQAARAAAD